MGVCTESTVDEHAWESVSVLAASTCFIKLDGNKLLATTVNADRK